MILSYPAQHSRMRLAASGLSLVVSIVYFIIAFGFVAEDFESPPAPVMFVAGLAYLIGGLVITRASDRLLRIGAVLNLMVIAVFVISLINGNSTVDALSVTGKLAQVGLELALVALIMGDAAER